MAKNRDYFLKDIVRDVASETSYSQTEVEEIAKKLFETITTKIVEENKKVYIVGFYNFERKLRKERMGRNLKTGESVAIPSQYTIHAKMTSTLKNKLKEVPVK